MTFQWPYVLWALLVVLPGLVALFVRTQRARTQMLGRFAAARLLPILLVSYSPALRLLKNILIASGVLLVVVALARPQWGYDWQENHTRGVDVVFVLDTSRSMLTPDVQPNRLERAKLAIYDCIQKMPGNRIGLVAFAGDAFLQCPLTQDYDAFRQTLDAVDTNTIAQGGSDIAVGLDAAATALEKSGNHKIIVLITDGEDLEGQGITEAKTLAEQGITIYTVGVGTSQGEIIPVRDASGKTSFVRDQRGELVKSRLDTTTLSDIANATHGFYQPLGPTGEGLMRVYENGIKKVPEEDQKSKMTRQLIERYQWPLAAGMLLLTIELLVGTRRPGWHRRHGPMVSLTEPPLVSVKPAASPKTPSAVKTPPAMVGALLLALLLPTMPRARAAEAVTPPEPAPAPAATPTATPQSSSPKMAQSLFEKGDYSAAAEVYGRAAEAAPEDGRFRYNQGESLYRNKDYEGAAQAFTKSLSISDLALQQRAYYNLGNTHYRLGQDQKKEDPQKTIDTWETAVKDFQNALDLDPQDADARYNLELVKKQIEELKKQQEQQKNQQQKKDDSKQDQQKQQDQKDQQNQQSQNQSQDQPQNQPQNQQQNQPNQQQQNNQQNPQQNQQNSPPDKQNQPQNQQNQSGSPDQSGQQKPSDQKGASGDQPNQDKQQSGAQNSPDKKDGDQQPQNQANPQNGKSGDQKSPQNSSGQQPKPASGTGQKPPNPSPPQTGQQPKNGTQPQPAKPSGTGQGKEPNAQKTGQQPSGASPTGGQPTQANGDEATANGTVAVGMMTREEAMQLLNSLKTIERKLPASRLQNPPQNPSSSDQDHKDW